MPQPAGLQAGLLSISAGRRGRSGVSEPAASSGFLPSLPVDQSQPPEGLPLYQLPHGPCGREAKEGRVGVPAAGGRAGRGRKGQTVGRGWPTSRVGKARSCEPGSPPSTLTRSGRTLPLPAVCGQRGPLWPARLCSWPGLREVPTAAVVAAAVAVGLRFWPSSGSSSSSPKSSPVEAKGEGGGREREAGRRRGRGQQEGGGRRENAEVLKGTLTSFLGFPWQPNIPQMNISVREREEKEGGNGGRWRQRWREIEAGDEEVGAGRWRKRMGQERWRERASRPRWRAGGSPPTPLDSEGGEGPEATGLLSIPPWPLGQEEQATDGQMF